MIRCATLWTAPKWKHIGIEEMTSLHCLLWLKHMGTPIRLHTDSRGAQWAKALRLPVEVVITLDGISNTLAHAWSLGKLYTYTHYTEPFLHVDLDVMLGAPIPERVMRGEYITEKAEHNIPGEWFGAFAMDSRWREAWRLKDGRTFNMGMFGGSDTRVIRPYAEKAIRFISDNAHLHHTTNSWNVTATAEQWGFAREVNPLDVTCYLPSGDLYHKAFGAGVYQHISGRENKAETFPRIRAKLEQIDPAQAARCRDVKGAFSHF